MPDSSRSVRFASKRTSAFSDKGHRLDLEGVAIRHPPLPMMVDRHDEVQSAGVVSVERDGPARSDVKDELDDDHLFDVEDQL